MPPFQNQARKPYRWAAFPARLGSNMKLALALIAIGVRG